MKINMTMKGQAKLRQRLQKASEQTRSNVSAEIMNTATGIQGDAREDAPVDTNRLRSGIGLGVAGDGLGAEVFSNADYAMAVEEGTEPHMPPVAALKGWARRHGMEGAEWAIAKNIAQHGTEAQPFFWPAVNKWARGYRDRMKIALKDGNQ